MGFKKWADLLWPLGGTLLGLLVMPLAIEQYPEFLKENRWPLPISVVLVVACWILPFFLHERAKRIWEWATSKGLVRISFTVLIAVLILVVVAFGSAKLFRFHSGHLASVLHRKRMEVSKVSPEDLQQIKDAVKQSIEKSVPPKQTPKNRTAVKPAQPFSFAIDVGIFSPSRDRTVMLYLVSPGIAGTTICPANLALYLRLQNLQTIPARLSGWSLELGYGNKWIEPIKLDSRFGTMYFVGNDPKKAGRVDSQSGLDVQLASKSYVLKPNEVVEGWVLFEYSKDFPFFAGGYKLSVKDTLGHEWSGIVSWPDPKQKNTNLLGGSLRFVGLDDVTIFTVKYCDEDKTSAKVEYPNPAETKGESITIDVGPSTNPKYAFETRFILSNHGLLPLSDTNYTCELQGIDANALMKLNQPVKVWPVAMGPIGALAPDKQHSIYCDFTGGGLFVDKLDRPLVQIWISYNYGKKQSRQGFQFLAMRKEDGTFVWLPRGEAQELEPN